jgi:hypothetical protein
MEGARWPNLFVIGAAKAGTTALWRYLGEHPDVYMSPWKEPYFFTSLPYLPAGVDDAETYLGLFADSRGERYRGEASAIYLWGEHVPEEIRQVSPEARIVVSLREPVELSHRLYLETVAFGLENRTFPQALHDELVEGKVASDHPPYARPELYTSALERYLDTFGDRVFVLFFDDLVADTRGVVRRLYEFLEIDPTVADRVDPRPHNSFALPRNSAVASLVHSRRALRAARAIVPHGLRDSIWRTLVPYTSRPDPDPESVEVLRRLYEPDVLDLRALLDRPLPEAWERRFPVAGRATARSR